MDRNAAEKTSTWGTSRDVPAVDITSTTLPAGVRLAQAGAQVWSKRGLAAAYVVIWMLNFLISASAKVELNLSPYILSHFHAHSMSATAHLVSSVVGAVFNLPLSKVLDVWGRLYGFLLCVVLLVGGLVTLAVCNNVVTYAVSVVLRTMGCNGLFFTFGVFVADNSALRNRMLCFWLINSPTLLTTWLGGPLASAFRQTIGWRWAAGIFALVLPVAAAPFVYQLWSNVQKTKRGRALTVEEPREPEEQEEGGDPGSGRHPGRTLAQSVKHHAAQFDLVGLLLFCAGLALFLLPFNLYSQQSQGWGSPLIYLGLTFGVLCLAGFGVWEKFFARARLLPFDLLTNRTVVGGCVLAAIVALAFTTFDSFFISFLQVVNDLDMIRASYIASISIFGIIGWAFFVGLAIRWSRRYTWIAFSGSLVAVASVVMMLHVRRPGISVALIIVSEALAAVGFGSLIIAGQMGIMAAVPQARVAVALALETTFISMGAAVGSTIASAVHQNVFPRKLREYLPAAESKDWLRVYQSLDAQKAFAVGSPARDAVDWAYADAQKCMTIVAIAMAASSILACLCLRNIKVEDER